MRNATYKPLTEREIELETEIAQIFYGGFVKCPTTGRIREVLHGDNKVLCNCRTSNPKVPAERTDLTGTHIVSFCEAATARDYVLQRERDRAEGR